MQVLIKSLQKQIVKNLLSRFIDINLFIFFALNAVFLFDIILFCSRTFPFLGALEAVTALILYHHHIELKLDLISIPTSMLPFFRRRILKDNVFKLLLKMVVQQRVL